MDGGQGGLTALPWTAVPSPNCGGKLEFMDPPVDCPGRNRQGPLGSHLSHEAMPGKTQCDLHASCLGHQG